jgi:uncharacterized protein YegL
MDFRLEPFYNRHLAPGTNRVDVVLSITAQTGGGESGAASAPPVIKQAVVAIVVDMSGSMQGEREDAARSAVRRAISLLNESTQFFIIAFSSRANLIFGPAFATAQNKAIADEAARRLAAGGGTYMSSALKMARELFQQSPGQIRYALFLTDGKNAEQDENGLTQELGSCDGVFQCDCRGVGTDWEPKQLRRIAEKLLGTADIIPTPAQMEADFMRAIQGALSRSVSDVRLRIWTPKSVSVAACKLVSPRIEVLLDRGVQVDPQTIDFPTGAWSPESRDYYLAFSLPANEEGEEMLACRPSLVYGRDASETRVAGGNVVVDWTSDDQLSARIDDHVAHYTGQQELASAIEEGLEARQRGDVDVATRALGKAAKIAAESGNHETTQRLAKVVDIVDAEQGTVRLKAGVSKADEMDLDLGSTRTSKVTRS